jgi:hypothetical protein
LGQGFTVIHKTSFFAHKMDSLWRYDDIHLKTIF